jgi:hypothetical protein
MIHLKQKANAGTCAAVAYASILHLTELQGIRECKTIMRGPGRGTYGHDVIAAFKARGIETYVLDEIDDKPSDMFWLVPLSRHFPLYVSTTEGRNKEHHAIVIADGMVYDGHYDYPVPLDSYKPVKLKSILLVDQELPTYQSKP